MNQVEAVRLWAELKGWYGRHFPEALQTLNQGAQEDILSEFDGELKQEVGEGLPHELRAVYLENDGQKNQTLCGVFFGLEFLSVASALMHWREWRELANDTEKLSDLGLNELGSSYSSDAIRSSYAVAGWLPFAYDGNGNFLSIDLQPSSKGRVGQIINFGPDEEDKYVIASSFGMFLEWLLVQYGDDNYVIAKHNIDGYIARRVEILNPRRDNFLDAVPLLFK